MRKYFQHILEGRRVVFTTLAMTLMLVASYAASLGHSPEKSSTNSQSPIILIRPQPDAPLAILPSTVDSADPRAPEINYLVVNISQKSVRAYAIIDEISFGNAKSKGAQLSNIADPDLILKPGQSVIKSLGGDEYSSAVQTITLSVDFVEFIDGTTFGNDIFKSRERLDGQRAGARVVTDRLSDILKKGGQIAVVRALDQEAGSISIPPNNSLEWEDGFRVGVGMVIDRLKKASKDQGLAQIEPELKRPFDSSGRR